MTRYLSILARRHSLIEESPENIVIHAMVLQVPDEFGDVFALFVNRTENCLVGMRER